MRRFELGRVTRAFAALFACAVAFGCAASRGADPAPARPAGPPYPVTLAASDERVKAARAAWTRLLTERGAGEQVAPDLQPVTATLRALPAGLTPSLRLPLVTGPGGKEPGEEETREALRRFVADAAPLLGVVPEELSLVSYEDAEGGLKRAVYRQQPFEFPLRGDYGTVSVTFTRDRRVVALSSTAIPEAERLRRALAAAPSDRLTAEQAVAAVSGEAVTARELVVLPMASQTDPATLELHVAWEVSAGGASPSLVYVDAVTGRRLATWTEVSSFKFRADSSGLQLETLNLKLETFSPLGLT